MEPTTKATIEQLELIFAVDKKPTQDWVCFNCFWASGEQSGYLLPTK